MTDFNADDAAFYGSAARRWADQYDAFKADFLALADKHDAALDAEAALHDSIDWNSSTPADFEAFRAAKMAYVNLSREIYALWERATIIAAAPKATKAKRRAKKVAA